MFKRLFGGTSASQSHGLWPRDRIEAYIMKRFREVRGPHLRDEYVLYGVQDGAVAFVVILHHPVHHDNGVDQLLFYTRFEDYAVDDAGASAMNRNLHISVVQLRDGALDMFAGLEPHGPYNEAALQSAFDSWKRDLTMVVSMLTGRTSFPAALGLDKDARIRELAVNARRTGDDAPDLFASLVGRDVRRAACGACGGRGKVGLIARSCDDCAGTGLVAERRRRE
jgi:hypothetical protein